MEIVEILKILAQGEDSKNQFKKDMNNPDSLAQELIAFSNTLGGRIFVGVDDDGSIPGLTSTEVVMPICVSVVFSLNKCPDNLVMHFWAF